MLNMTEYTYRTDCNSKFSNKKHLKSITTKTIMLVEDNIDIKELVHFFLTNKGFKVISFDNASPALQFLQKNRVDLIISDIMMADIDGFEFCSIIKNLYKDIYFIFLSAKDNKNDISKAYEVGCDEYIVKPFEFNDLLNKVSIVNSL